MNDDIDIHFPVSLFLLLQYSDHCIVAMLNKEDQIARYIYISDIFEREENVMITNKAERTENSRVCTTKKEQPSKDCHT